MAMTSRCPGSEMRCAMDGDRPPADAEFRREDIVRCAVSVDFEASNAARSADFMLDWS